MSADDDRPSCARMSENVRATFEWLRAHGYLIATPTDDAQRSQRIMTKQEQLWFSQGFDRGNYGNAYESTDWEAWAVRNGFERRSEAYRDGMILGFFSSYELDEIADEEIRDLVEGLRVKHAEEQ